MAFGALTNDDIPQIKIDEKELSDLICKFFNLDYVWGKWSGFLILVLLEAFGVEINKIDLKQNKDGKTAYKNSLPGLTLTGDYLLDLLQNAGINPLMRDAIFNLIDKVTSYLTEKGEIFYFSKRNVLKNFTF